MTASLKIPRAFHTTARFSTRGPTSLTDGVALFYSANQLLMCNWTMWPGHENTAEPGVPLQTLVRKYLELEASQGRNIYIAAETTKTIEQHTLFRSSRDIPIVDGRWFQLSNHPIANGGFAITCTDINDLKKR